MNFSGEFFFYFSIDRMKYQVVHLFLLKRELESLLQYFNSYSIDSVEWIKYDHECKHDHIANWYNVQNCTNPGCSQIYETTQFYFHLGNDITILHVYSLKQIKPSFKLEIINVPQITSKVISYKRGQYIFPLGKLFNQTLNRIIFYLFMLKKLS